MTQEEKCRKADRIMDMATTAQTTNAELAIKHTMNAIELCPSGIKYAYLSLFFTRTGAFEEAVKYGEVAVRYEPNNPAVLEKVAFNYYVMSRYNEAVQYLGKTLYVQPNNPLAREMLAEIYIMQRELKKGENELLKNIQSNPNYDMSYYSVGKLYMDELSDAKKAYEYFTKYIMLAPKSNTALLTEAKKRINILESRMPELKSKK